MSERKHYDVLVIGSGGGLKIARPAAEAGLKTALIEQSAFGGTCLNRGCIPSKMLIYPADYMHLLRRAERLQLHGQVPPAVDFTALVEQVNDQVSGMSEDIRAGLEDLEQLDVYPHTAHFTGTKTLAVHDREISADRIFIASGSRPLIPDIPGLADSPYMTSTDALRTAELPRSLTVLGGGYIACELGHMFSSFGTETHFLVRSQLLRREDRDIQCVFDDVFSEHNHIHRDTVLQEVVYRGGMFHLKLRNIKTEELSVLESEQLLVACGVVPNTDRLQLEHVGIETDANGYIQVNEYLETAAAGVYALGDCIGRYLFRHSVNYEGEYLERAVLKQEQEREPIHYTPVPHAVFTHPEIAGVGATEQELETADVPYFCGRADMASSNMGKARQLDHGMVKLLFHAESQELLGAHIVGEEASDLIHTLIALMNKGAVLDDLLRMIFIHPALPEVIRSAAKNAAGKMAS